MGVVPDDHRVQDDFHLLLVEQRQVCQGDQSGPNHPDLRHRGHGLRGHLRPQTRGTPLRGPQQKPLLRGHHLRHLHFGIHHLADVHDRPGGRVQLHLVCRIKQTQISDPEVGHEAGQEAEHHWDIAAWTDAGSFHPTNVSGARPETPTDSPRFLSLTLGHGRRFVGHAFVSRLRFGPTLLLLSVSTLLQRSAGEIRRPKSLLKDIVNF